MGSFYAELHVAGHVYVLRRCDFSFTQATDGRGRVVEKVRHNQLDLEMDVPRNQFLEAWAAAAHKPLPGHVTFFHAQGGAAHETVSWEAGHCVRYREEFDNGRRSGGAGAYLAFVAIVAPKLTMSAGGPPAPFVVPAPREHSAPPTAFPKRKGGVGPDGMAIQSANSMVADSTLTIYITPKFSLIMATIKQQVLDLLHHYNQGRPVSYPALDRKMLAQHPDLVKDGQLGAVLDAMVAEKLIEQVRPSSYQVRQDVH